MTTRDTQSGMKNRLGRHARGFSLVELLVVLGVVLILISLLMPAVAGAKQEALRRVCQSEMRQLAIMITAYCDENNGRFPFPFSRLPDGNFIPTWRDDVVLSPVEATGAGWWPVSMFDDFGRNMYADVLMCPNDQHSLGDRRRVAQELGIPESQVQQPPGRSLSEALYLTWQSLRQNMEHWDDRFRHVNAIHNVDFPSQKAMLIEEQPLHEPGYYHIIDETGEYIATLPDPARYHQMIAAIDGSAEWRLRTDCVPGVEVNGYFRAYLASGGMPGDEIELQLSRYAWPEYFLYTRDGVRGRDW